MHKTLKHILHTYTHTYVQLDTLHTWWVFRGGSASFCLYLKMKGRGEERQVGGRGGGIRGEDKEKMSKERGGDRHRGGGQRKREDEEEEE